MILLEDGRLRSDVEQLLESLFASEPDDSYAVVIPLLHPAQKSLARRLMCLVSNKYGDVQYKYTNRVKPDVGVYTVPDEITLIALLPDPLPDAILSLVTEPGLTICVYELDQEPKILFRPSTPPKPVLG